MKYTDIPSKVPLPFASSGSKNTIPTASQIGITPGAASLTDGFPPLTFTPVAAGGVPPSGKDFNGLFNLLTASTRWANAGGFYKYDSVFSTAVGGYPSGAVLLRGDGAGLWISTADDNTSDPDTGGANWTGMPFGAGAKSINANTTLTVADAGLIEIDASGGNVLVTLPAASVLAGLSYQFARTDSSNNTVTISAGGSYTIESAASITVSSSDRVTLVADGGTSWRAAWATSSASISPGFVGWFANNSPPNGYIKANGASVSRTTYADLYSAIGTTFGAGDGSTTFNVPDLRGEFLRGFDDGRGVDSGRALGSSQLDSLQGHWHEIYDNLGSGVQVQSTASSSGSVSRADNTTGPTDPTRMQAKDIITDGNNGGPRVAAETRPRNVALLACIKY